MRLLHLIFARLSDDEIRKLHVDILANLQSAFLLSEKLQRELLGRLCKKTLDGLINIRECNINGLSIYIHNGNIREISEYKNESSQR